MKNILQEKLKHISETTNFQYLLNEEQNEQKIKKYYKTNKLAYLLFHNRTGFLHMGLSDNGKYEKKDLLKSIEYIRYCIDKYESKKVLELGYGRGANLNYLASHDNETQFNGVDLSTKPLKRYTKNSNICFLNKDFHKLNTLGEKFSLIYSIEALCHSNNIVQLFDSISSSLDKKGYLIIYDGYYLSGKQSLKEYEKEACILVEKGMAVNEFHNLRNFEEVAKSKGFEIVKRDNLSEKILPSLTRFEKLAKLYFKNKALSKVVNLILPEMFIRNALSGYLMPELVKRNIAGYYLHVFQKL